MDYLSLVLSGGAGYLLGSLSFSIILSILGYRDDIRNHGSGGAGATNMLRTFGGWAAVLVLVGDLLKGSAGVFAGRALGGDYGALLGGFFAVIGHLFPLYFAFRGGKGVATAAGAILVLHPGALLVLAPIFVLTILLTRYVSLGSVLAAAAYPVTMYVFGRPTLELLLSVLVAILVIWMHRANIGRLLRGEERKLGQKSK